MLTAFATVETSIKALNEGAYAYIIKPYKVEEVKATIRNAIEKRRLSIENRALLQNLQKTNKNLTRVTKELEELNRDLEDKVFERTKELAEAKDKMAKIMASIAEGLVSMDKDFRITSFNKALEKITGYSQEEALSKKCQDIFQSKLCGSENCPMVQSITSEGSSAVYNTTLQTKEGREIPVNVVSNILTDDKGEVIGAVETIRDLTEITELRRKLATAGEAQEGILTRSPKMKRIMSVLPEFSKSDATILILGESGTGKELIAHSIHSQSNRQDHAFVAVNSGALPDTLLESELFGYKAGAFTDARRDRKGRFPAAEKGSNR